MGNETFYRDDLTSLTVCLSFVNDFFRSVLHPKLSCASRALGKEATTRQGNLAGDNHLIGSAGQIELESSSFADISCIKRGALPFKALKSKQTRILN